MAARLTAILGRLGPRHFRDRVRRRLFDRPHARRHSRARGRRQAGAVRVVRAQFRPPGRVARGPAPCARQGRDPDGLRLRAPARTDPRTRRALARGREGGGDPAQQPAAGGLVAQARDVAPLLSPVQVAVRHSDRARQRGFPAARSHRRRGRQLVRQPRCVPARAGSLDRAAARHRHLHPGHAQCRRVELHAPPHARSRRRRHHLAQHPPAAHRHLFCAAVRVRRLPDVRLFDHQLPLDRPHGRRLDLDHVGDRHARRRAVPGARDHRRICRPRAARDPALAALPDRGNGSLAAGGER